MAIKRAPWLYLNDTGYVNLRAEDGDDIRLGHVTDERNGFPALSEECESSEEFDALVDEWAALAAEWREIDGDAMEEWRETMRENYGHRGWR